MVVIKDGGERGLVVKVVIHFAAGHLEQTLEAFDLLESGFGLSDGGLRWFAIIEMFQFGESESDKMFHVECFSNRVIVSPLDAHVYVCSLQVSVFDE